MSLSEKEMEDRLNKIHAIFEAEDNDAVSEEALQVFSDNIADVLSDLVEKKVKEAMDEKMAALAEGLPDAIEDYLDESITEVQDELASHVSESLAYKILNILEGDDCDKEDADDKDDKEADDDDDKGDKKGKKADSVKEDDDDADDKEKEDKEDDADDEDSKNESYFNGKAFEILESLQDHMSYNEYQKIAGMLEEQYFDCADDVRDFFEAVVDVDDSDPEAPVVESFVEFCARSMRI